MALLGLGMITVEAMRLMRNDPYFAKPGTRYAVPQSPMVRGPLTHWVQSPGAVLHDQNVPIFPDDRNIIKDVNWFHTTIPQGAGEAQNLWPHPDGLTFYPEQPSTADYVAAHAGNDVYRTEFVITSPFGNPNVDGQWDTSIYKYPIGISVVEPTEFWQGVVPATEFAAPAIPRLSIGRTLFPAIMRPLVGAPEAAPIPYKAVPRLVYNPALPQNAQRQAGYYAPWQLPQERKFYRAPYEEEYVRPPVQVSIGNPARFPALPRSHARVTPGPMVKEIKTRIPRSIRAAQKAYGVLTETLDIVNILYRHVPLRNKPFYKGATRRYLVKNPTFDQKLRAIYKSIGASDYNYLKASYDLALNQTQDALYGVTGQISKQISADLRPFGDLPIGFQIGSSKWRSLTKGK